MITYADSSFVFSAFGADANTSQAIHFLRGFADFPILVSRLTLFETENAYRAAVLDGRMPATEVQAALRRLNHAQHEGFIARREVPAHQWFPQAHRISTHDTHQSAARALDILHVAAALVMKAKAFLSFDERQRQLAAAEGLKVGP